MFDPLGLAHPLLHYYSRRFANGEVYAGEFIEGQQDGRQKVWLGVDRGGQSIGTRASLQHLAWIQMDGKISLKCTVGTSQECHKV